MKKRDYPEHNPDWLRTEHYAKLSKKENPYGFVCILCYKTHFPKNCPNSKTKETPTAYEQLYNHASDGEWYGD